MKKKILIAALTGVGLLLSGIAGGHRALAAETTPTATVTTKDADPALWVIKDADTTIYLFGTVHLLKPGLGWFDEAVEAAFKSSSELVLELPDIDEATAAKAMMAFAVDQSGQTLSKRLNADQSAIYVKAMGSLKLPPAAFDRFEPWAAALTLGVVPLLQSGYDPKSGAEDVLKKAAKAAGKPIIGLETAEQQFGYFDNLPMNVQVNYLVQVASDVGDYNQLIAKTVDSWAAGDPDTLASQMNSVMDKTPEVKRVLLAERNQRWAVWIKARLEKPGTVFMAVGAGHLAGKDSVQDYVTKQKIGTVTRVKY